MFASSTRSHDITVTLPAPRASGAALPAGTARVDATRAEAWVGRVLLCGLCALGSVLPFA